jgi:hypothetical protein
MDTGLFGGQLVFFATGCHPLASHFQVVETDGTDSSCGISILARTGAWRIGTKQASASLVVYVYCSFHRFSGLSKYKFINFEHLCKDNVNEWNIKAKNVFFDLNLKQVLFAFVLTYA